MTMGAFSSLWTLTQGGKDMSKRINYANGYSAIKFNGPVETFIDWCEKEYKVFKDVEIIKHIPHASLELPESYKDDRGLIKQIAFGKNFLINNFKMTDLFVDQIFDNIPGVVVKAKYTRLFCDVEKYRDDSLEPMSKYGQGYVYTKSYDGKTVFKRHLKCNGVDSDEEVDSYYEEHHKKLTEETKKILKREKKVLILDLHSFSNEQALSIEKKEPFPDICIGINEGFANNEILDAIIRRIEANGYSYKINYPYSGSIIPNGLTKSELENVCSIMIEVNKRLYLG